MLCIRSIYQQRYRTVRTLRTSSKAVEYASPHDTSTTHTSFAISSSLRMTNSPTRRYIVQSCSSKLYHFMNRIKYWIKHYHFLSEWPWTWVDGRNGTIIRSTVSGELHNPPLQMNTVRSFVSGKMEVVACPGFVDVSNTYSHRNSVENPCKCLYDCAMQVVWFKSCPVISTSRVSESWY